MFATTITMKALRQQKQYEPLQLETVPIPTADPGSAVIKVLVASTISYTREIYDGTRKYPYVTPLTAGSACIGRISAVGPDSTSLNEGQLVIFDITLRSRDDASHVFLSAIMSGYTAGSRKLMEYWTDGAFAEYIRVPLENAFPLDETRLFKELGYSITDLTLLFRALVPWGGLVDVGLKPGETVIVAPATGGFGGAAVHVALAMGARVIAMGRDKSKLAKLEGIVAKSYPKERITTVPITGSREEETAALTKAAGNRGIDVFFDISPPAGFKSSHFIAAIRALKHSGRISLMGGQRELVEFDYSRVMHWNLQMKGKWMYEREDVSSMIRLVEAGNMPLGEKAGFSRPCEFRLEDWKEAFDYAFEHGDESGAVLIPNSS